MSMCVGRSHEREKCSSSCFDSPKFIKDTKATRSEQTPMCPLLNILAPRSEFPSNPNNAKHIYIILCTCC